MHQDNKHYLILLCSLMSQLKGLVLPLAMGLAERIVCRLVNKGLWRSWRAFKMLVCSCRGSCVRSSAYWLPPAFLLQVECRSIIQWLVGIITHSEIHNSTYHIRHASSTSQNKNVHNNHLRPAMFLKVLETQNLQVIHF